MSLIQLGKSDSIAAKMAPAGASLAWFEALGYDGAENFTFVDEAFSRRAFAAVAVAEGKTVISTATMTGAEINKTLGLSSPIVGAMFTKRFLLQYA